MEATKIMKKNKKKLAVLSIIGFATLCLAGCGDSLQNFANITLPSQINTRVEENISMVNQLADANFISESTKETLTNNLVAVQEKYNKMIANASEEDADGNVSVSNKQIKGFADAVSAWQVLAYDTSPEYLIGDNGDRYNRGDLIGKSASSTVTHSDGSESSGYNYYDSNDNVLDENDKKPDTSMAGSMRYYILSNYMHYELWNLANTAQWWHWTDESRIDPITLVDPTVNAELNDKFSFPIYVLKPNITTKDGTGSLDGVMEQVSQIFSLDKNGDYIVNTGKLNNYFVKVTDQNGEDVTLLDMENEDNWLIKESKNPGGLDFYEENGNRLGYDMLVYQYEIPILKLRFKEFNQDTFDRISRMIGLNDNKYVFFTDGDVKGAVLLEYPVSIVSTLTYYAADQTVHGGLEKSGIGLNILTQKIIKYDYDYDESTGQYTWYESGTPVSETADSYLTVMGADNGDQVGLSSFILKGMSTAVIENDEASNTKIQVPCGRIILRDYLEATYAPAFESGDDANLVVFGRKMRLNFTNWEETEFQLNKNYTQYTPYWNLSDDMATFIDKDGVEVVDSPILKPTDFCDYKALIGDNSSQDYVKRFPLKGESTGRIKATKLDSGKIPAVDQLACQVVTGNIHTTVMFPGSVIGTKDAETDSQQKQRFYCMTTTKGLFESNLYSSWIESASSTASLDWWNEYLTDNNFLYNVDHTYVSSYILGNYQYQATQAGVVILDLDIIAKIQKMFDEAEQKGVITNIRTFFVLMGWAMIILSIVFALFWLFDTNTDTGAGILEKATFGRWIAVKYDEDVPAQNVRGVQYITAGKLVIKCLTLIAFGIILIKIDVFYIVKLLINTFGNIAVQIEKVTKGFK
jgi:hypothetical protein